MDNQNNFFEEENEKPIDWKAVIMEYLIHWPYILIFLVLCMAGAYVYLRYQSPVYNVNATVLIKQGDKSKNRGAASTFAAMEDLGMLSMASIFDNEVEVIQSRTLIKKVVNNLSLNINYTEERTFGYPATLYKSSPVKVWMAPEEADRLQGAMQLRVSLTPDSAFSVKAA